MMIHCARLYVKFRRRPKRSVFFLLMAAVVFKGFTGFWEAWMDNNQLSLFQSKEGDGEKLQQLKATANILGNCAAWISLDDNVNGFATSCAMESAIIQMANNTVCLIKNRYRPSSVHLNTDDWIAQLNATYGSRRVVVVSPSYASVFGGTLFESTYINSEELTFLGPALVWALLWKYGGLLLKSNTLLLSPLQSYYNLIALKPSGKVASLAIMQFTDRHHTLMANVLLNLVRQIEPEKAVHQKELEFTEIIWTKELSNYCGSQMSKKLVRHLCHDTEVIGPDVALSMDFGELNVLTAAFDEKGQAKSFEDSLAIELRDAERVFRESLSDGEGGRRIRRWIKSICPKTIEIFIGTEE